MMVRIYRYVLVTLIIGLIVWGVWYVYSSYNEQRSKEGGTLVKTEREMDDGAGNSIY